MICEISNPSDPYTMEGDNELALALACMVLGEGKYGLDTVEDGKERNVCPIFLMGGHDRWLKERHGVTDLRAALDAHTDEIVAALESVMIGRRAERVEAKAAMAKMSPEDAKQWLAERHDRRRSSLNDIGSRAAELAKLLRTKAKGAAA